MSKTVLFLDIATHTGWCEGEPGGKPIFGSFRCSKEGDNADKFAGMFKWVAERCQAFKPRHLFFEAPLARNATTAEALMGMAANAQSAARLCGVYSIKRAHVGSVRKFFLPPGSPRSGDAVKQATIQRCRELGYEPKNDDEADAIAGWEYACSIVAPSVPPLRQFAEPKSSEPKMWGAF